MSRFNVWISFFLIIVALLALGSSLQTNISKSQERANYLEEKQLALDSKRQELESITAKIKEKSSKKYLLYEAIDTLNLAPNGVEIISLHEDNNSSITDISSILKPPEVIPVIPNYVYWVELFK
jgi:hypothetical protein